MSSRIEVRVDPMPPLTFPKQKARADMPDYTYVDEVALSYGDLPFQIVPIVRDVDGGGAVAPRPSAVQ